MAVAAAYASVRVKRLLCGYMEDHGCFLCTIHYPRRPASTFTLSQLLQGPQTFQNDARDLKLAVAAACESFRATQALHPFLFGSASRMSPLTLRQVVAV